VGTTVLGGKTGVSAEPMQTEKVRGASGAVPKHGFRRGQPERASKARGPVKTVRTQGSTRIGGPMVRWRPVVGLVLAFAVAAGCSSSSLPSHLLRRLWTSSAWMGGLPGRRPTSPRRTKRVSLPVSSRAFETPQPTARRSWPSPKMIGPLRRDGVSVVRSARRERELPSMGRKRLPDVRHRFIGWCRRPSDDFSWRSAAATSDYPFSRALEPRDAALSERDRAVNVAEVHELDARGLVRGGSVHHAIS
jgi:hypothetical protein